MEVFGYTRISVDLDEDSRENTSIENQKKIITDFVGSTFPDAHLTLFEDRDRSGYTFSQRESYQKMRDRMMSGECTILVVKDFSRFSRRNSLGLLELETLRDAGIRIISIGDGIDYPTKDDWMLIQFKFLMNEMPVTDTSRKIKQIIQSRQKDGKWVCAVPYGYRIINTKAMTYEIDPPAAEVVREIFRLYNNGWGYKKIANYLTDNGVPTPRANEISQKEAAGIPTKIRSSTVWNTATLSGLLANDFYIGTLRQKKYVRKGINGKDQKVGDEEHIVIENAHCPIIDPRTFAYTQEQMKLRTKSNYRGEKKYATDYSGFLFCGDCGSPMFSLSRPDIPAAYTCGTYHRRGLKGCTSHHIRVDTLDDLLKRYLKQVRDNSSAMLEELETSIREQPQREEEVGKTIDSIQVQLAQAREQLKNTLKRKLLDTMGKAPETAAIIEETYTEIENELTQRIAGLEKQIDAGNTLRNNMLKVNRAAKTVIDVFDDILSKPTLDKRDISFLVERISVYTDHLDVKLKPDIDTLLKLAPDHEDSINFSTDSKDIASTTIVQRSVHQKDKVFTVNVVNEGEGVKMRIMKKCIWLAPVVLMSCLLILEGKAVADTILTHPDLAASDYNHLGWSIQKMVVVYVPIWCLALLGLVRSFLGENWFPFAERIPVSVTKVVMAAAAILWVGAAVFSAIYLKQLRKSYDLYFQMEGVFSRWRTYFLATLYYAVLLYIEQWSIQKNCSRQSIRKRQVWFTVTVFLTLMILFFLGGVKLWYIPLSHVDSPNTLEDFDQWLFSLYFGVLFLPPWFLSARKTVRLFKHERWLSLSAVIPRKITVLTALILTGFIVWQVLECRNWSKLLLTSDLPERIQAVVSLHSFYAMVGGLTLFCTMCILIRQIRVAHQENRHHSEDRDYQRVI